MSDGSMNYSPDGRADPGSLPFYVFLDIDGVFCSERMHYAAPKHQKVWMHFDPAAIWFMNTLADQVGDRLYFVFSTSWKQGMDVKDMMQWHWMEAAFRNAGFRGQFALDAKTSDFHPFGSGTFGRALQIQEYLRDHPHQDYMIFDDTDYDFNKILGKKRFIRCDSTNGLMAKEMRRALGIAGEWK